MSIELGCGDSKRNPGAIGVDRRRTNATNVIADASILPFRDGTADEVWANCLLEHCQDPDLVLTEVHRILRVGGRAMVRLPNIGTYSAHLDTTHVFLADLALWKQIFSGYFESIKVSPVGTKYRDNPVLTRLNWLAVRVLGFHELAQGWDFTLSRKTEHPERRYRPWWV